MASELSITSKVCSKCSVDKPLGEFYALKTGRGGVHGQCKECFKRRMVLHRAMNPEKMRSQYKARYRKDPAASYAASREYLRLNPDKAREYARRWREKNPDKVRARCRRANAKARASVRGRLEDAIRSAVHQSVRRGSKNGGKTFQLLGYSSAELMDHLERLFEPGMTWDNYGFRGWHIDHNIPLSVHNYETPHDIDFRRAWALTNLQPMWSEQNWSKSDGLAKPFQPSLAF